MKLEDLGTNRSRESGMGRDIVRGFPGGSGGKLNFRRLALGAGMAYDTWDSWDFADLDA